MKRKESRRAGTVGQKDKPERSGRLPAAITEVAQALARTTRTTAKRGPGSTKPVDGVKARIVARLKRLHPMD